MVNNPLSMRGPYGRPIAGSYSIEGRAERNQAKVSICRLGPQGYGVKAEELLNALTDVERAVLEYRAAGSDYLAMAESLGMEPSTLRNLVRGLELTLAPFGHVSRPLLEQYQMLVSAPGTAPIEALVDVRGCDEMQAAAVEKATALVERGLFQDKVVAIQILEKAGFRVIERELLISSDNKQGSRLEDLNVCRTVEKVPGRVVIGQNQPGVANWWRDVAIKAGFQVAGIATNSSELLAFIRNEEPDLVVSRARFLTSRIEQANILRIMLDEQPACRVAMITALDHTESHFAVHPETLSLIGALLSLMAVPPNLAGLFAGILRGHRYMHSTMFNALSRRLSPDEMQRWLYSSKS
ncbi:MAG: hypothetical protein ABI670_20975 [Chloroflexota bacterium]